MQRIVHPRNGKQARSPGSKSPGGKAAKRLRPAETQGAQEIERRRGR